MKVFRRVREKTEKKVALLRVSFTVMFILQDGSRVQGEVIPLRLQLTNSTGRMETKMTCRYFVTRALLIAASVDAQLALPNPAEAHETRAAPQRSADEPVSI